ncbi:peptidylprolyl isomerase [Nanoarchaeota archaeon]
MKLAIILMIGLLLLTACNTTEDPVGAAFGDTVSIKYIGTFTNGTVFDTNVESVANANGLAKDSFESLIITIGQGKVIPGFEQALIGMNIGDKKTATLAPGEAYGNHDGTKVLKINKVSESNRILELKRYVNITLDVLAQLPGIDKRPGDIIEVEGLEVEYEVIAIGDIATLKIIPEVGDEVQLPNTLWNSTVIDFDDEMYTVRQDPPNGSIVTTSFGPARIILGKETMSTHLLLEEGGHLITPQGPGKVLLVNETSAVLDFNHPLAGETLIFDIERVS